MGNNWPSVWSNNVPFKAMDDIGVVMTAFGDIVTVILVANSHVLYKVARGNGNN